MLSLYEYFQGEKVEALVFILSLGILCLVFGVWLVTEGGSFNRGVAIPFLVMGLVMAIVGGVVGFRTPSQVNHLETSLLNQKVATVEAEIQRMDQVNKAWPKYLALWLVFGVVGLVLRMATKNDFAQGLGIALVFFSGVTLLIDGFAERRAIKYAEALKAEIQSIPN